MSESAQDAKVVIDNSKSTGFENYAFKPDEAVFYRRFGDATTHKGTIGMYAKGYGVIAGRQAQPPIWVVKLEPGDRNAEGFSCDGICANQLIPCEGSGARSP
jgi:hypothetical protein